MPSSGDPARPLDPCALVLVTNVDRDRGDQKEQEFPCHFECFRGLIGDDSLMYIMQPGHSTVGEVEDEHVEG
jgi:hypothetical protein